MTIKNILIVDDESGVRSFLSEALTRKGYKVTLAEKGKEAIAYASQQAFDLVITDMKMADMSGLEVLTKIKQLCSKTPVLMMTAFGTIENAVEAMHRGAFNYLLKPFSPDALYALIAKANEEQLGCHATHILKGDAHAEIITASPIMRKILEEVQRIAKSHATVLIHGESGTGKEVIARAIHHFSPRRERPYIKVNCAAIPDTLIESEFFGHEKGAFTGANLKRLGRFELADQGTLLLDEVTEIPLNLQSKLLRVVQEQEFERVGGNKSIKVDVRLIATSNRNLKKAIQENQFREDLYYRLSVVPIFLPPLRERTEDILPLATYFLKHFCQENQTVQKSFTALSAEKLTEYSWPGNIRELANIIERAVVLSTAESIEPEHLYI